MLFQDSTGGLEIEDWTKPDSFIFYLPPHVGDTLMRWTNEDITGGIHQVTALEVIKGESGLILPPRMSIPSALNILTNTALEF